MGSSLTTGQLYHSFDSLVGLAMRAAFKYPVFGILALFVALAGVLFFAMPPAPKPVPPLPFDEKVFISTTPFSVNLAPPKNAPFYSRILFFAFDKWQNFAEPAHQPGLFRRAGKWPAVCKDCSTNAPAFQAPVT